jgi:hypothetical protein
MLQRECCYWLVTGSRVHWSSKFKSEVGKGQLSFSLELASDRVLIDQVVELLQLSRRDVSKD